MVVLFTSTNATGRLFSTVTPISTTNKTDSHNITVLLLKVALSTITLTLFLSLTLKQWRLTIIYIPKVDTITNMATYIWGRGCLFI